MNKESKEKYILSAISTDDEKDLISIYGVRICFKRNTRKKKNRNKHTFLILGALMQFSAVNLFHHFPDQS